MRSRTERELAAQSVSFQKKQNSKMTAPTHAAPAEILNHSNRFCSPSEGHSLFVCFKPRAEVVPLAKALVEIHHLASHQWRFTHFCICSSRAISAHCTQARSANPDSVLPRRSLGPLLTYTLYEPTGSHRSITSKHTMSSCREHKCGDLTQSKGSEETSLRK